jgi:cystathionine gamma-lyase
MGVLVSNREDVLAKLRFYQNAGGAVPGSHDAWLAQRGAKTLGLRMERHGTNALTIARWLEQQPWVKHVMYTGLEGVGRSAVRNLAWRQLSPNAKEKIVDQGYTVDGGFPYGGMVSFRLDTQQLASGTPAAEVSSKFLASLKLFTLAESLGGVESLAELPSLMTHASVSEEDRRILGIDDELIRLSVGVEDIRDLERDLAQGAGAARA